MNENSTASTLRRHEKYDRLIAAAKSLQPIATAVAHPCDETSLRGAVEAGEAGLIKPILVGPKDKIAAVAKQYSLNLGNIEIVDVPHSQAAAEKAVELVRTGKADLLMKGSLHTDELLSEVMKRETGLRTGRRVSHVFVMDVPGHAQTLFITDAAVNIAPDLISKRDIIQNAIDLYAGLGLGIPKVAILSAVETVTPTIPSTIEAAALVQDGRSRPDHRRRTRRPASPSTTPSAPRRPASRASNRRLPVRRRSWWCRIWKPATCWLRI
jgi:phosphate acetyltransferase